MRALTVTGADKLAWLEAPAPLPPGPGEALVRVHAFAVNWADLLESSGRYPGGASPPFIAGHDCTGVVVAVGAGVEMPVPGDRVFGTVPRGGAAAEFVSGRAEWFHRVPAGLDDAAASGLAAPFFTADAALVIFGRIERGESVLIHAAAGGFGSAAVQLARAYGAGTIVATAGSAHKLEHVASFGADVLVDYTDDDFVARTNDATGGRGVDIVIESVGGDVLGASFDCIAPAGRIVSVGATSGASTKRLRLQTLFEKGIAVAGFTLGTWIEHHPQLLVPVANRVLAELEAGRVRPVVGGVFAADDVAAAYELLRTRQSIGRLAVMMTPDEAGE